MTLRKLTPLESATLLSLADRIESYERDIQLAELVRGVARGNDSLLPDLHDRLLIVGRPELAERLAVVVGG